MKIALTSEDSIRLEPTPGPLTIEAESHDQQYSPFHMLASGLAVCTYSVLESWSSHAGLDASDLAIEVRWSFAERPHRIGAMEVRFHWPSLPEDRRTVALRAAELCPIHKTLGVPPTLHMELAS